MAIGQPRIRNNAPVASLRLIYKNFVVPRVFTPYCVALMRETKTLGTRLSTNVLWEQAALMGIFVVPFSG